MPFLELPRLQAIRDRSPPGCGRPGVNLKPGASRRPAARDEDVQEEDERIGLKATIEYEMSESGQGLHRETSGSAAAWAISLCGTSLRIALAGNTMRTFWFLPAASRTLPTPSNSRSRPARS